MFHPVSGSDETYFEPKKPIFLSCISTERLKMTITAVQYYKSIRRRITALLLQPKIIETIHKHFQNLKDQNKAATAATAIAA